MKNYKNFYLKIFALKQKAIAKFKTFNLNVKY